MVVEHLGVAPATGRPPTLPEGWFEKFSWDSRPGDVTDWPGISDVISELRGQLPRLTDAITALSPQHLNQVQGPPHDESLRYLIVHGLHDEANHQGEIWLLRKMYGKLSRG